MSGGAPAAPMGSTHEPPPGGVVQPTTGQVSGTATAPDVTVVLCTSGRRPESLVRCIGSLGQLTGPTIEIIVVDNGRHPSLRDLEVPRSIRVIHEPRRGLDIARNRGVAEAKAPIVAFIDDDCEATPEWTERLVTAFTDPDVACVTGRVVTANPELASAQYFDARFTFDRGEAPDRFAGSDERPWYPAHPWKLGTGCNMAFRRDVLEQLGGFDPALDMGSFVGGGGDLDMFRRLLDRGFVAVYDPEAVVLHTHRQTIPLLGWQFFGYGATVTALALKGILTRRGHRRDSVGFAGFYLRDEAGRIWRRWRRDDEIVPLKLFACELAGHVWGPIGYLIGLFSARAGRRSARTR